MAANYHYQMKVRIRATDSLPVDICPLVWQCFDTKSQTHWALCPLTMCSLTVRMLVEMIHSIVIKKKQKKNKVTEV